MLSLRFAPLTRQIAVPLFNVTAKTAKTTPAAQLKKATKDLKAIEKKQKNRKYLQ